MAGLTELQKRMNRIVTDYMFLRTDELCEQCKFADEHLPKLKEMEEKGLETPCWCAYFEEKEAGRQ